MKLNSKAQSAMEYLMTYGWAILIILIAIGALFYLGVFNPKIPNTCTTTAPFSCIDVKIVSGAGSDSLIVGVSGVSSTTPTFSGYTGTCTAAVWAGTFNANGQNTITLTCSNGAKGDRFAGGFDITYTAQSGITHPVRVDYSGIME